MIILNPLPGQESMNTRFLLSKKIAVKAKDEKEVLVLLEELLQNPAKLRNIRESIKKEAVLDTSLKTARLILGIS